MVQHSSNQLERPTYNYFDSCNCVIDFLKIIILIIILNLTQLSSEQSVSK